MSLCLHCSYELVLLSRNRYKCSLCSKLFPQKQIENKTFKIWNQKQRELDIRNYKLEKEKELIQIKQQKSAINQLFRSPKNKEKLKEYERLWGTNNKEEYNEIKRNYWNKNSEKINTKKRIKYKINKEHIIKLRKLRLQRNPEKYRLLRRLTKLRTRQKALAQQICINNNYKLYTKQFQNLLPTFLHSYLLFE